MRKPLFVLYVLLIIGAVHSLEDGQASISLGVLGIGSDTNNQSAHLYSYGHMVKFNYRSWFGLGLSLSPCAFYYQINNNDDKNILLTFANISLDYNIFNDFFDSIDEYFFLGPFAAMNALQYAHPTFFEFRSGVKWSVNGILYERSIFNSEIITVELGYKYTKYDQHRFYAELGFDLIAALQVIASVYVP